MSRHQSNQHPLDPDLIYFCRVCEATPDDAVFAPAKRNICTPCRMKAKRLRRAGYKGGAHPPANRPCRYCGTQVLGKLYPGEPQLTKIKHFCGEYCRGRFRHLAANYLASLVDYQELTIEEVFEHLNVKRTLTMNGRQRKIVPTLSVE